MHVDRRLGVEISFIWKVIVVVFMKMRFAFNADFPEDELIEKFSVRLHSSAA